MAFVGWFLSLKIIVYYYLQGMMLTSEKLVK